MLLKSAVDAGTEFLSDAQIRMNECDGETRSVTVRHRDGEAAVKARVVIVASGLSGLKMTAETGCAQVIAERSYIGAGCLTTSAMPGFLPGTIYMACGRMGYVGAVVVEEGLLNVAAALDPQWVREHGGVNGASVQLMKEAGVEPPPTLVEQHWQATPLLTRRAGSVAARRLLLVGDAAGYVEPFTGEGMAWALASGRAVVPVIDSLRMGWDVEMEREWTRVHRQLIRGRQRWCRAIAWSLRRPTFLRYSLHLLRHIPSFSQPLIRHLVRPYN
jgi:flavin-dependent dehydrogenase